jgi:hypothetical protein
MNGQLRRVFDHVNHALSSVAQHTKDLDLITCIVRLTT